MTDDKKQKRARRPVEADNNDGGLPPFSWWRLAVCFVWVCLVDAASILDCSPGVLSHPLENDPLVSFVLGVGNALALGTLVMLIHMVFVLFTAGPDLDTPTSLVIAIPKRSARRKDSNK